ncbi:CU044_2847 family protein [Streptomyces sp. N35]|uniref:CU044_2847 family protein n=1 Tax=Streptomyces sp. N35 TaxID=2795730 RepID=UPI00227777AB|nr:CU044_2847 family protein [Streptomyces sp. N35]
MGEYLEFSTEDGTIVPVDFAADDDGQRLVSGSDGAVRATRTFESSLAGVRSAAEAALRTFQGGSLKPDSVEIEFGVKLTAEAGALIAKSAVEGHLVVKLAWAPGQQGQVRVGGPRVAEEPGAGGGPRGGARRRRRGCGHRHPTATAGAARSPDAPHTSRTTAMNASWQARIRCGREFGAGFLVTDRHVLTCAHVVSAHATDDVTVTFPHLSPDLSPSSSSTSSSSTSSSSSGYPMPAEVVAHGGWTGGVSPGDLAVLELAEPVGLRPAEFASPAEAYGDPPPRLLAYGFLKPDSDGVLAEYRATGDQRITQEWNQLEAWGPAGQTLDHGFSGAALTLAHSGKVVGMVSTTGGKEVRNGRMLPAQVMAHYWPRLGDLIPTGEFAARDKERLRTLIDAVGTQKTWHTAGCAPDRLYRDAVGPLASPPLRRLKSLWDVAWYLLSECQDTAAIGRFATRLADYCEDAGTRTALRELGRAGRPAAAPAAGAGRPAWSPVLVEIAPSGSGEDRFLVEVSAYNGAHRHIIGQRTLTTQEVRPYVLERIDDAYREVDLDGRELIAFVLPRKWLNTDVVHWQRSKDDHSPLGSFAPVVVVELERRRSGMLQHKLRRKWQELDLRADARLHRIGCGAPPGDPVSLTIGLRRGADLLGLGAPPGRVREAFKAGLNAPVPAVIWPRGGCAGGPHDVCAGKEFLDRLAERLAGLPPGELPDVVYELRLEALGSGAGAHWAHDLSLLWEDPRALPETAPFLDSPVG